MNTLKTIFQAILILSLTSVAVAEPYALGWEQVNAAEASTKAEYTLGWDDVQSEASLSDAPVVEIQEDVVEPPVAVNLSELPGKILAVHAPVVRYLPGPSGESDDDTPAWVEDNVEEKPVPRFNIELSSHQHFDHYKDRYRQVEKVEVVTYRGGYPQTETHENFGSYTEYDVTLQDLKPGDRYEVKVTWDDGSYRCLDTTVDEYPERNVIIDEPMTLGCSF